MQQIWIGCSGFSYKDWRKVFYPEKLPQSKWFEFYCQHFKTLEINSSFYKFPTEKSLNKWYQTSPVDFKFSLKVPRLITHYKKFADCENLLTDFYKSTLEGLKDKLGCVLFQLPPSTIYTKETLKMVLNSVDSKFNNVFEFRHASWWNEEVYKQFKSHNLIFSGVSFPKLPQEIMETADNTYFRFHGVPVLYKSLYSETDIDTIYNKIKTSGAKESWVYFNNTWGTAAIENARYLQKMLGKS